MTKRALDLVLSGFGLLVLSPLLIALAIAVKIESPGPVFYRGARVGRNEKDFRIFKFRSMVINADKIGGPSTAGDDPRVTRTGRLLRKYKLDELSQLINVLKGEMSLVGPRPEVRHYVNMFTEEDKAILTVRPGMTDWASLWNNDEGAVLEGAPDPEKAYMELIRPKKLRLQLRYVRNPSVLTDLKIFFLTLRAVITGKSYDIEAA
jgi:lipopolysaccharide/colanic/teichoic acid biosynthesis glycosyltransferase